MPKSKTNKAQIESRVVAMRREGLTYREIGRTVGVSRQEVANILEDVEEDGITGLRGRLLPLPPRVEACVRCGTEFTPKRASVHVCSQRCAQIMAVRKKTGRDPLERAAEVIRRRESGETWASIARSWKIAQPGAVQQSLRWVPVLLAERGLGPREVVDVLGRVFTRRAGGD
jgi:hypothetical protein